MPMNTRSVTPGARDRTVCTADGQLLDVPPDWELLPPGDATLTRRVKSRGPTWTMQQKKGRKTFSLGVWAPATRIAAIRAELGAERATELYQRRRATETARRDRKQTKYVDEFRATVLAFLDFAPVHAELGRRLADAVTQHATPVGSGTVARTQRISIGQRAESAVIAWLRHKTTAYDDMKIPRIRGKRREVRRMLAERSRQLLERYRNARADNQTCPLQQALSKHHSACETTQGKPNSPRS